MIYSKYNYIVDLNDKKLLYNSNSGALIELDNNTYERIKSSQLNEAEKNLLIEKKVFVKSDRAEINRIKFETHAARSNTSHLNIVIAPTYFCNFDCVYCYEEDRRNVSWNEELKEKLIEYITKRDYELVNLTWYGGEPLLQMKAIHEFTQRLIKKGVKLAASMITNGYLLNEENIQLMKESKISDIQVTIDGDKEIHDKKRPLLCGKGTYDKILSNLKRLNTLYPEIVLQIRVNIDKTNCNTFVSSFTKFNKELSFKRMQVYPGIIDDLEPSTNYHNCLMDREDVIEYMILLKVKHGIDIGIYPQDRYECMAPHHNSYIIGADGEMFKCWLDVGKNEKSIGNLLKNEITNIDLYYQYIEEIDQFEDKECIECSLLPICQGGCPYVKLNRKEENVCHFAKGNIDEFIKLHYENI